MKMDLKHNSKFIPTLEFNITSATSKESNSADGAEFESLVYSIYFLTNFTATSVTISLLESDDNSTFTVVSSDDLIAKASDLIVTSGGGIKTVGYKGSKRYTKVKLTPAGTSIDVTTVIQAVFGNPLLAPTT